MKPKRRKTRQERAAPKAPTHSNVDIWPGDRSRAVAIIACALICLSLIVIYGQTVSVPPIDYEDPFYLVHSPYVSPADPWSRLSAVWTEPYFANFHPLTTTTWLIDRAFANKSQPFDGTPFRIMNLVYAALAACLLILLFRRLGLPAILAALSALVYSVHPVHTEVIAWLSARKDLISLIFMEISFLAWLWARAATTPTQWKLRHASAVLLVLLAVLSKPIAVILPALFVAYEFCSEPHDSVIRWRWTERQRHTLLTRTLALTAVFIAVAGISSLIFRTLLAKDPLHGGWLILVTLGTTLLLLALAPSPAELAAFGQGNGVGLRVLAPPLAALSVVCGAGSAWTFWAQSQVGAIKGGLSLLPTLNLTLDAMLAYAGKALVPAFMSASYGWNDYPYVSLKGVLGAILIGCLVVAAMRLAGSPERNRRLLAFGIFWYLIAFVPVANLVPTSTKMADRYLFVPTVGAILALLALAADRVRGSARQKLAVCAALLMVAAFYTAWSYRRTEVWCGKTTLWNGHPHPDLSLWTSAVETDPNNTYALNSLALAYLRLNPPDVAQALTFLNRALQLSQASQEEIAGGERLDLSPVYQNLGDAYMAQASGLVGAQSNTANWQLRKQATESALKYLQLATASPSGFASADARLFSRLAEAYAAKAQIDSQQLSGATPEQGETLLRERDQLRSEAEEAIRHAREILAAGNVAASDPNFRTVLIQGGNIIFGREVGAPASDKPRFYRQALSHYQEAAALFPDDPRPYLYQGLCYERLAGLQQLPAEKQEDFKQGEAALRTAIALNIDSPDYSPAMPYRVLGSLYAHVNDYSSVLDSLKKARQADPAAPDSETLNREIQNVEKYLAQQPH